MRKSATIVIGLFVVALLVSGCDRVKNIGGTGPTPTPVPTPNPEPNPNPNPGPVVNPPGPPTDLPPGTDKTSVTGGYFTISEVIVGPGPHSELVEGNSWSFKFRITVSCEAPDQFGFGFTPEYRPADDSGVPLGGTTLFFGMSLRAIRPCESMIVEESGPIFLGAGIVDVPNILIRARVGQNGEVGWLRGPDFSTERVLVRVNLKKRLNQI